MALILQLIGKHGTWTPQHRDLNSSVWDLDSSVWDLDSSAGALRNFHDIPMLPFWCALSNQNTPPSFPPPISGVLH